MGYFELAVGLLFVLALLDLTVGVSNDAVNFLNSAIGSRVASRRVILAVAGAGVVTGSLFSSGIMEVARSGIFNPEQFVFADVMVIFLAVMLADILILDLFNTLGLPTSTTVSIVFELLGAATAVAVLLVLGNPDAGSVIDYINARGALMIISGIVLSIVVAFVVGTVVQFLSRALFTFQARNHTDAIRIGWSSIAFTVLSYFLVIKGLKGASFITAETYGYIMEHAVVVTLGALAGWSIVMWLLNRLGVDLVAAVVFAGTFSLALAFASNDLVNFIGVPLAGFSSWQAWSASGVAADAYTMEALLGPVRGDTPILLGAGLVMVMTLWLSSKAQSVTETEVNLARQDDGNERFRPGPLSRGVVRGFVAASGALERNIPLQWRTGLAQRFEREAERAGALERPAFDTLRASVNLTVASILIVLATSLKLPLSTTFVSFMVAMGTALADRAWGRDTAVYRLAGVFSVVGGWFITAFAAFSVAAVFAVLIRLGGGVALGLLVVLAAFALLHTHRYHRRNARKDTGKQTRPANGRRTPGFDEHFTESLATNASVIDRVLSVLVRRDRRQARLLRAMLKEGTIATRRAENEFARRLDDDRPDIEPWLKQELGVLACQRDMLQSISTLAELASEHVLNEHTPPSERLRDALGRLNVHFRQRFDATPVDMSAANASDIAPALDDATQFVLEDLYAARITSRNAALLLGVVLELGDLDRELDRIPTV